MPGGEAGLYLLAEIYLRTKRIDKAKVYIRITKDLSKTVFAGRFVHVVCL